MGRGGCRIGAGRKSKDRYVDANGEILPVPKKGPKSKLRQVIESRMRELLRRGHEFAKQEATRLASILLPFDEPKLQSVTAETTTTVRYVARIPTPIKDISEWQKSAETLLLPSK